jgi:H+/Cl- antiporter ClcA
MVGKWLIVGGAILIVVGSVLHFAPWLLSWFGRLPGDIRIQTERSKIFIPIVSMLILSIVLTLLINLLKK